MPQVQLPIFPAGSVEINRELACRVEGEQVVYFNGHLPVFAHAKSDLPASDFSPVNSSCRAARRRVTWPERLECR